MKTLEAYKSDFLKLKRAYQYGGAPHKPILLLSVLDAIERGFITSERIYITIELQALFRSNWNMFVKTPHKRKFALPFYHLSNEPFWDISLLPGKSLPLTSKKSIKSFNSLNESISYALIDKDLFFYLSNPAYREEFRNLLMQEYFPNENIKLYASTYYLDEVAEQILKESAVQYKRTIKRLEETETKDNFEEEIYIRNGVFKSKVPETYNYTCAISGMRVRHNNSFTLIDGCHIQPFADFHDDTITNGIALCPNLHRAFDKGLITISNDHHVIVSNLFTEDDSDYSIKQFHNKKLLLPNAVIHHPRKDVLEWHRDSVFEKDIIA